MAGPPDPTPTAAPRPPREADLPDEGDGQPLDLADLDPALGALDARRPLPAGEELLDEAVLPPAPPLPAVLPRAEAGAAEAVEEEDLAPVAVELPDEAVLAGTWLRDDGLASAPGEVELDAPAPTPRPPRVAPLPVAGWEELVLLVERGGLALPATLAPAREGSELVAPLLPDEDGVLRLRLGEEELAVEGGVVRARVRLGPVERAVHLRLVDGPGPRLVLGRDALAGALLVDPAHRYLLTGTLAPPEEPAPDQAPSPDGDAPPDPVEH